MSEPAFDIEARAKYLQGMIDCIALPDARANEARDIKYINGHWYEHCFCMSCGKDCGYVMQENGFVGWLCPKCEPVYGHIDGLYLEPDFQHWARIELEQLNTYGRRLTEQELLTVAQADATPLASLINEGR